MSESNSCVLAEKLLQAEFRRLASGDPQQALDMVTRIVLAMHSEAMKATETAIRAGVGWREIGRALGLLDDAGILVRQSAALLLRLAAADRAAEQEMVAQALAESGDQDGDDEDMVYSRNPEEDAWASAVLRYQQGVSGATPG
ncbi:hypothetical protein F610DRAFT_06957 [Streptomyces sp. LaPpAH-199]|uniref:hypothetical protein n=1 Tax=Streptomyces TaxID=1883 RepID=UPI00088371DF|nr:hypothetical protein [Streptomyces sp. LaPpAH-199]MYW76737.1 hypothetical protein [Streptomyces sp. SID8369]SDE38299.1 hypothetical protein F610DRAFT_06957 [Streptomyces sp. LaPpAH-199]